MEKVVATATAPTGGSFCCAFCSADVQPNSRWKQRTLCHWQAGQVPSDWLSWLGNLTIIWEVHSLDDCSVGSMIQGLRVKVLVVGATQSALLTVHTQRCTFESAHCTAQSAHIHSAHPDVHSVAHIGAQWAHKLVHTLARFAQLIIAHGAAHGDNCRL